MQGVLRRGHRSLAPEQVPRKHPLTRAAPTSLRTIKDSRCSLTFSPCLSNRICNHRYSGTLFDLLSIHRSTLLRGGVRSNTLQFDKLNRPRQSHLQRHGRVFGSVTCQLLGTSVCNKHFSNRLSLRRERFKWLSCKAMGSKTLSVSEWKLACHEGILEELP